MTRLITHQKIRRRARSKLTERVPVIVISRIAGNSRIAMRAVNVFDSSIGYALVGIAAIIVLFIVVSGLISMSESVNYEDLSLGFEGSANELLTAFVTGARRNPAQESSAGYGDILASFQPITYTIERGDTISEIAASYDIRIDTLISYNAIEDVRSIRYGSVLKIPALDSGRAVDGVVYTVRSSDTLSEIALRFGVELNPILDINNLTSAVIQPGKVLFVPDARMGSYDLRRAMGTLFIMPVTGRLTSTFGMRSDPFLNVNRFHYGVDWANTSGTPVRASNNGVVSTVGESDSLGKYIVIDHYDQFQTLYAHLDSWSVRKGSRIEQGETIGKLGNTGRSTGPHLHFAIYKNHKPVDPLNYVR